MRSRITNQYLLEQIHSSYINDVGENGIKKITHRNKRNAYILLGVQVTFSHQLNF